MFEQTILNSSLLVEGSMYDRLKRLAGSDFDPELAHLGLIYSEHGRTVLHQAYADYIAAASTSDLPLLLFTPTWRANSDRVARSAHAHRNVNREAATFVDSIRTGLPSASPSVFIGGLIGCRNDCYDPALALSPEASHAFHETQISFLAESPVDMLFSSTLPAVSEAVGMAKAMAATELPFILSFVIDRSGRTLDGTPIQQAFEIVDSAASRAPLGYFVNCVHPHVFLEGIHQTAPARVSLDRLIGFQGNTSLRDPREFDSLTTLETESPDEFARAMMKIKQILGVNAFGGCCGTGPEHISAIGKLLSQVE